MLASGGGQREAGTLFCLTKPAEATDFSNYLYVKKRGKEKKMGKDKSTWGASA